MSIFGRLFDKKGRSPKQEAATPLPAEKLENDPNLIRVFDKYGQELFIAKEQWRTNVLPGAIQSQWNNPDQLYTMILTALNDGLFSDVLKAGEQLHRIDPNASRGACVYAIVLMKCNRLDEAEQVLRSFVERHGEDGSVLTNLAKVYAARNEMKVAEDILWHALEVDPNQDNGLDWYVALQREHFGEEAGLDALRRIAALPESWRAQMWLAGAALKTKALDEALTYYRESLSRSEKPVPADLLVQISGDLGNHGHLSKLLELTEKYFVPEEHGLLVGNNLIKAHLDLGHFAAARGILDQLYSLNRPDWKDRLNYWDTEIAKARLATSKVELNEPTKVLLLSIEGPVWLNPSSPATKLFPANRDGPAIFFLGSTASTSSQVAQQQLADTPGGMSRALPLFLAEQVKFACQTNVHTFIPWVDEGPGAFMLSGVAWSDADALEYSRRSEVKSDFIVVTHLKTESDPWIAVLRLLRTDDGTCVSNFETSFFSSNSGERIRELSLQLVAALIAKTSKTLREPAPLYQLPDADYLASYLLRLEQLLAVRCATMDNVSPSFLHGEREILDGNLQLCLQFPDNVPTRILLTQTLLTMNKVKPTVVREFSDRVALLQKEKPLRESAQSVVHEMLRELNLTA